MQKHPFIVIEGTDGSGKTTQLNLLKKHLDTEGKAYKTVDFPQYDKFWGKLIGRYLSGEFGELDDISPYLIQPIYMLDQATQAKKITKWKNEGNIVLANRYITSSMAHQTSKFKKDKEKAKFLDWMTDAGYNHLGVSKEDLVVVLYVPPKISFKLAKNKDATNRKNYTKDNKEIAEDNFDHQKESAKMYKNLCKRYDHWQLINCIDENNNLLTPEDIHQKILKLIKI